MVIQNFKTARADGASCSVGGGGRGKKGKLGANCEGGKMKRDK